MNRRQRTHVRYAIWKLQGEEWLHWDGDWRKEKDARSAWRRIYHSDPVFAVMRETVVRLVSPRATNVASKKGQ